MAFSILEQLRFVHEEPVVQITAVDAAGNALTDPEIFSDHLLCRKRIADIRNIVNQDPDSHSNPVKDCKDILFVPGTRVSLFGRELSLVLISHFASGLPNGYASAMQHLGHTYEESPVETQS